MFGIKIIVKKQYQDNVNRGRLMQADKLAVPTEGWIRTVRKALGMSGAALARRLGVTRALVSNTEKSELGGGVTLKTMQKMAMAMNCRFVYAIVPEEDVEELLRKRAIEKARRLVKAAGVQMALEDQALSKKSMEDQVQRLADEMLEQSSSDLWND